MSSPTPGPRVFICHSHFDTAFCHRLRDFLLDRFPDATIFLDESALRGGSWFNGAGSARTACRKRTIPSDANGLNGFRLALGD